MFFFCVFFFSFFFGGGGFAWMDAVVIFEFWGFGVWGWWWWVDGCFYCMDGYRCEGGIDAWMDI